MYLLFRLDLHSQVLPAEEARVGAGPVPLIGMQANAQNVANIGPFFSTSHSQITDFSIT